MNKSMPGTGAWTTRRFLALLGSVFIWAVIAIDIWYLWPTTLGGSTSLVIVSGASMEPTFSSGDLVIARELEPSVGDVIVYTPEGYGDAQIVHRIIGGNGEDGWVVQGDNNSFIDPFEPTNDDVRGVVLVSYPHVGLLTGLLLNPILWAGVILAALVMLLWFSGDEDDDEDEDEDEDEDAEREGEVEPTAEAESEPVGTSGAGPGGIVARILAVFAVTGALVIGTGGVTAFASGLTVTAAPSPSTFQLAPCWTAGWASTVAGTPSGGNYTQVQMTSIPVACQGQVATVYVYSASNTLLATGTGTPNAGTFTFTVGSYSGAAASKIWVKIDGWPVQLAWTPPTPPAPAATCVAINPGNQENTSYPCTVSITPNGSPPWGYDNGTMLWNYTFGVTWTTTPPNTNWRWRVTFNHAQAPFPGFTPQWVGLDYNPGIALAPGYSCTQQPVMVVQSTSRDVWGATVNIANGPAPSWFGGQSLCN